MIANTRKRIAIILLVAIAAASVLTGCNTQGSAETESTTAATEPVTTVEETTTEHLLLPEDLNFNGYEFTVLVTGNYANNDFKVVEDNTDQVNVAKMKKNSLTEERFGITISNTDKIAFGSTRGAGPGFSTLQQSYIAGTCDYDLAVIGAYDCATLAYNDYLTDLNQLTNVELEHSWWDSNAQRDLTVQDKLFFTAGDISLTYKMVTHCILFNKEMIGEYSELRNPYELVNSDNWTYDTFGEEVRKIYTDINANSISDRSDRFGLLTWNDPHLAIITSAGEKIVTVNDDGELELTLYTPRTEAAIAKYFDIAFDSQHAFNYQYGFASAEWNKTRDAMFNENRALYYMSTFVTVSRHRNMETDFGILPYPKLDTDQVSYGHTDTPFSTAFIAVPTILEDEERTGAIVEALAYYSKNEMTPAYYERTLSGTYFRDNESSDMLDLIFSTRSYDLGTYYNIGAIATELTAMTNSRQNTFSSLYARIENAARTQIDSINEKYDIIS